MFNSLDFIRNFTNIYTIIKKVVKYENITRLAIDFIEENITNEKDTENINILIDYVKNKYIYFGNFDKKIIKEFVNKLLKKEIII